MSIYAPPSTSFEGVADFGTTGLVGTLTVAIMDNLGNYTLAPTTAGLIEFPPLTGIYQVTLVAPPDEGQYSIVFENPLTAEAASDDLFVTSTVPPVVIGGPGDALGPLSGWITGADVAACCDVEYTAVSIFDDAAAAAQSILFQLSGRIFPGFSSSTARPCRTQCGCPWQVLSRGHIVWNDYAYGVYPYGWWWGDDGGGCGPTSEVKLSGYPVTTVTEVKINGAIVDPATYQLERSRYLVRMRDPADPTTALRWPGCQNMTLPDTEEGTFSVTYNFGQNPPRIGMDAAAQLACEIYKQCAGLPCQLPAGTSKITRQGVQIEKEPFLGFAWAEGRMAGQTRGWRSGLGYVDAFLNAFNPGGLKRRPVFWSPSQTHRYAKLQP